MKVRYGIVGSRPLADFLPTLTIAAKNLATEMTNHNVIQDVSIHAPARGATPCLVLHGRGETIIVAKVRKVK